MTLVLKGDSWFVSRHYLTIRRWSPTFVTFHSIIVWVHLSRLPVEYYDSLILKEIIAKIRPIVGIDANIVAEVRGRYAKLCSIRS